MDLKENIRPFLLSFYAIGVLVIITAISEPVFRFWPPNPGQVGWRFGFAGGAASAGPSIAFGMALLLIPAILLGHARTARVFSVLSMLGAVIAFGITVLFALDALQIRATVNPDMRRGFTLTVARAATVWFLTGPVLLAIGLGGWRSARRRAAAVSSKKNRTSPGMLVHPQP